MEKRETPVLNRGALLAVPVILVFLWAFFEGGMEVAVFRFRGRALPVFELSVEGFLKAGGQDLDFASHPAFSKRFRLRGDDETAVRNLFNPRVLDFFESLRDDFGQTIEGAGEYVVVYRSARRVKPEAVKAFVEEATAIAAALVSARR